MTDNVVSFTGFTKLDLDPDRVLEFAAGKLESVLIVGFTKEGTEYFASSKSDAEYSIYMAERAKHRLMKIVDELREGE